MRILIVLCLLTLGCTKEGRSVEEISEVVFSSDCSRSVFSKTLIIPPYYVWQGQIDCTYKAVDQRTGAVEIGKFKDYNEGQSVGRLYIKVSYTNLDHGYNGIVFNIEYTIQNSNITWREL